MIGILGGTFDPVHFGHLRVALELREQVPLDEVRFVPCRQPPHRGAPLATPDERLAMLRLALDGEPGFLVDERELRRAGPSFTIDTLRALHAERPGQPLALIVGWDAFLEFPTWREWRAILELGHLIVARRPGDGAQCPAEVAVLLEERRIAEPARLAGARPGAILPWAVTQLDISATEIRALIAAGRSPRYLLPDAVLEYIGRAGLYARARP